MPDFASRDPRSPAFWDERFERGFTPWDRGGVPAALRNFVERCAHPLRTLIPGCGAAYELAYLCDAGWDATAIDFSPGAVAAAKAAVGPWSARVREADFFSYIPGLPPEQPPELPPEQPPELPPEQPPELPPEQPPELPPEQPPEQPPELPPEQPLELIYERAFLCALPRAMWPRVAARWAELLAPGALLAGFFFFDEAPKGPPFGIAPAELDALLAPSFRCVEDAEVGDSIAVFAGKERWMVWQRN